MDVTKWGYTIFNEDYTSANCWGYNLNNYISKNINTSLVLYDSNNISLPEYLISITDLQMHTILRIKGNNLFSFNDTIWPLFHELKDNIQNKGETVLNNFTRTIKNTKYLFIDGKEQLMLKENQ
jgi:hypothetical protein